LAGLMPDDDGLDHVTWYRSWQKIYSQQGQ
jgi:hypothetical protein